MNHGDAFAGIGGFGLAARRVGFNTVWACEVEPSARAIYSARLGHDGLRFDSDIRESRDLPNIDILTGGFPCQDLSVAGKRAGLAGKRSGLFFELIRILEERRPEWFVFENVPGLLSSDGGRDMGIVLAALVELGYGVAWRILNAQFFGVAQRRRRVFLVGHSSGDERRAAAILFESEGMRGDHPPGDEAGQEVAGTLESSTGGGFRTTDLDQSGAFIVASVTSKWAKGSGGPAGDECQNLVTLDLENLGDGGNIGWRNGSPTITLNTNGNIGIAHSLRAEGFDASEDGTGRGTPLTVAAPILSNAGKTYDSAGSCGTGPINLILPAVSLAQNQRGELRTSNVIPALGGGKPGEGYPCVIGAPTDAAGVREATGIPRPLDVCPVCENGPDSPRYRGLGNAVAVPVVEWILKRIAACGMTAPLMLPKAKLKCVRPVLIEALPATKQQEERPC